MLQRSHCAAGEDGPGERARAGSESDGARGLRERGADKRGPVGRGGALAWLLGDVGRPLRACWAGAGQGGDGPRAGFDWAGETGLLRGREGPFGEGG